MKFDITDIDKIKLLQAIYKYSDPFVGVGAAEFIVKKNNKKNVSELSEEECKKALSDFLKGPKGSYRIFDYYNGKPLKVVFDKYISGRVVIDSNSYDERNGKYCFLSALLSCFDLKDILIIDKSTPRDIKENDLTKEKKQYYRMILKTAVKERNKYGNYWRIDSNK